MAIKARHHRRRPLFRRGFALTTGRVVRLPWVSASGEIIDAFTSGHPWAADMTSDGITYRLLTPAWLSWLAREARRSPDPTFRTRLDQVWARAVTAYGLEAAQRFATMLPPADCLPPAPAQTPPTRGGAYGSSPAAVPTRRASRAISKDFSGIRGASEGVYRGF